MSRLAVVAAAFGGGRLCTVAKFNALRRSTQRRLYNRRGRRTPPPGHPEQY